MIYAIHENETLVSVLSVPEGMIDLNIKPGQSYIEIDFDADPNMYWVDSEGVLQPKTEFPVMGITVPSGGSDDIVISNIPVGTTVVWPDGEITTESDGTVSCDTPYLGEYRFMFIHPRHYMKTENINVTS
jgi:hypothetical protein